MKVMNIQAVNAINCNQKTREETPSFKALRVFLSPESELKQGRKGFMALYKYLEIQYPKMKNTLLSIGSASKKNEGNNILGIIKTEFNSDLEKAVNKWFFKDEAKAFSNTEIEKFEKNFASFSAGNEVVLPYNVTEAVEIGKIFNKVMF